MADQLADISVSLQHSNPSAAGHDDAGGKVWFKGARRCASTCSRIQTCRAGPSCRQAPQCPSPPARPIRLELRLRRARAIRVQEQVLDRDQHPGGGADRQGTGVPASSDRARAPSTAAGIRQKAAATAPSGSTPSPTEQLQDSETHDDLLSVFGQAVECAAGCGTGVVGVVEREEIRVARPGRQSARLGRRWQERASCRWGRRPDACAPTRTAPTSCWCTRMRDMVRPPSDCVSGQRRHSEHLDFDADGLDRHPGAPRRRALSPSRRRMTKSDRTCDGRAGNAGIRCGSRCVFQDGTT